MPNKMLIDATHTEETRVVVLRGNRIEEFDFESAHRRQLRGNIYLAKVTRVEPSLQAAFVDYGGNRHGFLAFGEIHPDYYQIPVADRQALIAEEARAANERANSEDRGGRSRRGRRYRSKDGDKQNKTAAAKIEDAAETVSSPPEETEEPQTVEESTPAAAQESAEQESGEETASDENAREEEEAVESVGGGDAMEEVSDRPRRIAPRRYKIQEVIKRRQVILVQVVKEERGNKGAALTTYLSLAGRYSVLMPNTARGGGVSRKITSPADRARLKEVAQELEIPEGMGVIIRTAGASRTKLEIKRDVEYLMRLWENVAELTLKSQAPALVYEEGSLIKRAIRDLYNKDIDEILVAGDAAHKEAKDFMRMLMPSHAKHVVEYTDKIPIFSKFAIETQLEQMFQPQVQLKSGGYIVINQTEALVSIDVNSGRSTREHNIEDTALRTNLEAAEEISRQLRLRDLAGLIVIDFIDMIEKRNNRAVERRLKECLRHDRARIQVGRISHFGLLEMSRQRLRASVFESTTEICTQCNGAGHVRSASSSALQILRMIEERLMQDASHNLNLRARTKVALYILNQKRAHLRDLEERFGVLIFIDADDKLPGGTGYSLERSDISSSPRISRGVQLDSVEAFDIQLDGEDEAQPQAAPSQQTRGDEETGEEFRASGHKRHRRRRRRGGGREDHGRQARFADQPGENAAAERGEDNVAGSEAGEKPDRASRSHPHPRPRAERRGSPGEHEDAQPRIPRRRRRNEHGAGADISGPAHEEQGKAPAREQARAEKIPEKITEDDDGPPPVPRIPDLPELKQASSSPRESGGPRKAGWWSKKLMGE